MHCTYAYAYACFIDFIYTCMFRSTTRNVYSLFLSQFFASLSRPASATWLKVSKTANAFVLLRNYLFLCVVVWWSFLCMNSMVLGSSFKALEEICPTIASFNQNVGVFRKIVWLLCYFLCVYRSMDVSRNL